jgi:hypothetical protein
MMTMTIQSFERLQPRTARSTIAAGGWKSHNTCVTLKPWQQSAVRGLAAVIEKAIRPVRALVAGVSRALAEHRIHRAAIETELYGGRYKLATKNDDDLPIVLQVAPSRRVDE